jgi:tetratricopeptide (TPR) repeat protein
MGQSTRVAVFVVAAIAAAAAPALANRESDALRARAASELYNMDREQAIATYQQAIAADPQDAAAYRGLAGAWWLHIAYRRGNMTVDDYLGRVGGSSQTPTPPPAEAAAAFRQAIDKAVEIARRRISGDSRDADAHFQLGAALGLQASYIATIEQRTLAAFRSAREAYNEHERVLDLDARRKDAALVVGSYRYIVSTLAAPARWVAYVAGLGGGKERGMSMVEEAAAYGGDNQTDARLALVLIYNRERRYDDALKQLSAVRMQYPRNRLVWLETGSTHLRAGRPAEAERILTEGMTMFARDDRTRMFGENALWSYKRGAARAALGRTSDAEQDLRRAVTGEGRKWVQGRAHLELGKLAIKAGRTAAARQELQMAVTLCDADNDRGTAEEARRLMK